MSVPGLDRRGPRSERFVLLAGAAITASVALAGVTTLAWTPYDPAAVNTALRLAPPSALHPFGTDAFGRDALSLVMAGARTARGVAVAACAIGAGVGVPLGLLAAARRGWTEALIARATDLVFAFPALLLAVLAAAAFGPGAIDAVVAIGVFSIPVFARVTRTAARAARVKSCAPTLRAAGKGALAISGEHVLPNVLGPLLVQAAIQFALAIVAEAGLAYVGLSAQPPEPSWGRMLAEAQTLYVQAPWLVLFPGGAIVVTVLGFSLLGEGLRALLAPRAKG